MSKSKPNKPPTIHLLCNSHLDPAWQWTWQDGVSETLSTFRTAADLCEEFDEFVFNHNESILYEWVEQFEPALFKRIQKLVKQGKWHIIGGWYLQPDCNMPSGESLVRQILVGKTYFREKFGVDVKAGVNFDSFGHSRGLVQILAKSGYDYYLCTRPNKPRHFDEIDGDTFVWIGFDGSEILARRDDVGYGTRINDAGLCLERRMEKMDKLNPDTLFLWGVGDHGGGASRKDLRDIRKYIRKQKDFNIVHSSLEGWFKDVARKRDALPRFDYDLNPTSVGCYTTMIRLKQKHRRLENEIYSLEKMASAAALQGLIDYPKAQIEEAVKAALFAEFHDMLPGSGIQDVEEDTIQLLDHGLEIAAREKLRAFFALAAGQRPAHIDNPPIMVYNPHPFNVQGLVELEFHLHDFNWRGTFFDAPVYQNGRLLPCQTETELAGSHLDWAKHEVFWADLKPGMNRFDTKLNELKKKPSGRIKARNGRIRFKSDDMEVIINTKTGLVDRWRVGGKDVVAPKAFQPVVIQDSANPWGYDFTRFKAAPAGRFKLMSAKDGSEFSGLPNVIPSVRIIEDGSARSVIEAVFAWGRSRICQRYKLPKFGTEFEVETRVVWSEVHKCLKLAVPLAQPVGRFLGQVAYGVQELPTDGDEAISHKWQAVTSEDESLALTCIDDGIYGSDICGCALRLTLLRSAAYSNQGEQAVVKDRHNAAIDAGERIFRFWFNAGPADERLARIDREALSKNEVPYALSFFPPGDEKDKPKALAMLSGDALQIAAAKIAEKGDDLILRLFNPTGQPRSETLSLPWLGVRQRVKLGAFEIRTLRVKAKVGRIVDVNLLERPGKS